MVIHADTYKVTEPVQHLFYIFKRIFKLNLSNVFNFYKILDFALTAARASYICFRLLMGRLTITKIKSLVSLSATSLCDHIIISLVLSSLKLPNSSA